LGLFDMLVDYPDQLAALALPQGWNMPRCSDPTSANGRDLKVHRDLPYRYK
jgi:hypothetical protein